MYILHKLKKKPFLFKRAHHKISEKSHQLTLILADKCLSVPSPRREIPDLVWGVVLLREQSFTPEGIFEVRQAISKVLEYIGWLKTTGLNKKATTHFQSEPLKPIFSVNQRNFRFFQISLSKFLLYENCEVSNTNCKHISTKEPISWSRLFQ